jgi:redox-sensitive bicupin YhaK (pirin superfamily)
LKAIQAIHSAPGRHWVGDGFPVRSLFSYDGLGRELSPFLLLDYASPTEFTPTAQRRGVGEHPHRGFETVTIVYAGEVSHRDSTGGGGTIGPGDVQWMTAGGGIVHEEFHSEAFGRQGGTMHMVQLWVNLPAADKMTPPTYQSLLKKDIPVVELAGGRGSLRVIAGEYAGARGPAHTFSPIDVWDVKLKAGGSLRFDAPAKRTMALVVLDGTIKANGRAAAESQLVVFDREAGEVKIEAEGEAAVLVLSGEPLNEPIVGYGPFVMNTEREIRQAIEDFNRGRFGQIKVPG